MEVVVPCNESARLDISSCVGSSTDLREPIECNSTDLSMNDLKTCLTEFLNNEDIGISTSGFSPSSEKNDEANGVREYECEDKDKLSSSNLASDKCFSKCASFPPLCGPVSSEGVSLDEKEQSEVDISTEVSEVNSFTKPFNQRLLQSLSLPIPLKLVSAMKGSRENLGIPPKKLSVTWAPDVYDPIPTSVSHVPSNKNQRCYRSDGKKSGKRKQKGSGKSSRGSRGKDKKQGQKNVGSSNKLNRVVGFAESRVGCVDFGVGIPDPSCGSSYLKTSVTELNFPAAEAT